MVPYFHRFEDRAPPAYPAMSQRRTEAWQFLAGLTIGVSIWYLYWRWTASLNPDAMVFSIVVAVAETLFFVGSMIFFHDIWREQDTPKQDPPICRPYIGEDDDHGIIGVDIFITTFDEEPEVVAPTISAALALKVPANIEISVWILDDGSRPFFAQMAHEFGVGYLGRHNNRGFKAGNLKNALLQTSGDFVLICDADTRLYPAFLENTLGYFRDDSIAWVQTPHWFYDIHQGQDWEELVDRKMPSFLPKKITALIGKAAKFLTGQSHFGSDPMLSEPALFFDVIQRRRNRNGASFCCGAGSIHRREALFQSALFRYGHTRRTTLVIADLEPFKFHVSEDIYTSIQLHSDPQNQWKSVYHPDVECRMLSPWTMDAWATQKLKYAGGTFDIMLKDNPVFKKGMPWRIKLHYCATFSSYLSVLWVPIMMLAPIVSILTGWAPVKAYSIEFFMHILPVLFVSELAMVVGCKGHNINIGRIMAIGGLPITLRALWLIVRGQKPKFPTTPKTPVFSEARFNRVMPNVMLLGLMAVSCGYGVWAYTAHLDGYSLPFLVVNFFWIAWNAWGHLRVVAIAAWRPPKHDFYNELGSQIPMNTRNQSIKNAPI